MGVVYLAEDTRLHRKVALKLLPAGLTDNKDRLIIFEQEAEAASALNHPNILTVHEFGTEGHSHFMVMEFVEGETLSKRMASGPLSVRETLDIAPQIASALSAAHEAGIIHCDIKPENIMLRHDGLVKVLDFGLAKLAEDKDDIHAMGSESPTRAQVKTNPGVVMGTPNYMSPEQVRGSKVDSRTDIFSLGVVLYEMLAGRKPFTGDSAIDVMSSILREEPAKLQETSLKTCPALQEIIRTCLEKRPERRFRSAHDLGLALKAVSSSSFIQFDDLVEIPAAIPPQRARASRRELLGWGLAAGFALVAAASLLYLWAGAGKAIEQRVFRQLNFRSEAVFRAAFAPDGKTVVYSAAAEGNTPEIFLLRPEFPAPQALGARGMHLLSVSSTGELAILVNAKYIWHRTFSGTLARMPLVGGAPREILEDVREADWSPDGSQLAIIREVAGKDRLEYPIGKVLCEVSGYMSDLRISPSGGQIAFFEHPRKWDDRGSVDIVGYDGKKTMLSDGYWSERGLCWSPDGKEVLFSASFSGGNYVIFAVTLKGARRIADQSPGGLILQDVAPDGRWMANRIDYRYSAMVHLPGALEDRDLSWLRTSHARVMSQDGQTLLFMETSMGNNYAVCLRKTDGSPLVRLGDGIPMDLSPDGKRVLAVIPSKPPELVVYLQARAKRDTLTGPGWRTIPSCNGFVTAIEFSSAAVNREGNLASTFSPSTAALHERLHRKGRAMGGSPRTENLCWRARPAANISSIRLMPGNRVRCSGSQMLTL